MTSETGLGSVGRARALWCVLGGLVLVAFAAWLAVRGVEPAATWLYSFAWYPLLVALEGAVALRHGRFFLLGRLDTALSVLAWSIPLWMVWELLNFRVENWYYVFVPDRRVALWTGVVTSFATVLPACFLPAALFLPRRGPGTARVDERVPPSPSLDRGLALTGGVMLVLPLILPRVFFPLIWGGLFFLAEAYVVGRTPRRSLVADVMAGRWARPASLLAGGAVAGLAWESLNALARGKWIYTVPWFEQLKLFEMPPLGFLGFPPLALSCFALYQALVLRGWAKPVDLRDLWPERGGTGKAPDPDPGTRSRPPGRVGGGRALGAGAMAGLFVVGVLLGMERWTISSRTPRLRDLPGLLPSQVETLRAWGVTSPFDLAEGSPGALARLLPGVDSARTEAWISTARLATNRGLGTRNARLLHRWGVRSLPELAAVDTAALRRCFQEARGVEIRPAVLRVWWRAARRRTGMTDAVGSGPAC